MPPHPHPFKALRTEISNGLLWRIRVVVMLYAAAAGIAVVAFTWLTEHALALFFEGYAVVGWGVLLWVPLMTATIVWATRRWAAGAAGSGIPQVIAAIDAEDLKPKPVIHAWVSLRLSLFKMGLTASGLLAGLSLGREGPSVQIAAGVMLHARRWLPRHAPISDHSLLTAGGAAGIAAAFNTPLGGIMFALEELSRRKKQDDHRLMIAAIVLAGLIGISAYGNVAHFGALQVTDLHWDLFGPALLVSTVCGVCGGLFARLLVISLTGSAGDRFSCWRSTHPIRFAAACGFAVALIGLVTQGATFGSGYLHTKSMLEGTGDTSALTVLLKTIATWLTAWSGVPGGLFAPSLAIGGAMGHELAQAIGFHNGPALVAVGMAAFLAAVTQAPITAFIIVMEMVSGQPMVLSLMASALWATGLSRLLSAPLYVALASFMLTTVTFKPTQT